MSRSVRIGSIYRKELINILRDRRAMLAMIIIPVVMYPALMLGFVRADGERRGATALAEVRSRDRFRRMLPGTWRDHPRRSRSGSQGSAHIRHPSGQHAAADAGRRGATPRATEESPRPDPFPPQLTVHIAFNEVNARSRTAMEQLSASLGRYPG